MDITIEQRRKKKLIIHEREKMEKCVVAIVANAFEMTTTTGIT